MILSRSTAVKASLTFLLVALILITLILAESPNLRGVDFKLLPNNNSSKLVPKSLKYTNSTSLEPNAAAQQPNADYQLGNNQPQSASPNYPNTLINLLAPTLLPGLSPGINSAEQQLSPYQLQNASPQQLQRLRQMQEMQQLQRQRAGGGLTDLIGAFIPGSSGLLGGARGNQPNAQQNVNNGANNRGTLAQLLGLSPQQPNNGGALSALGLNPYTNNNAMNQQNLQNSYGRPNANLRSSNANNANANSANDNTNDNKADDNSSNNGEDNGENGEGDNSGENNEEGGDQANQQDPSQDPDIQQFNNLQGNENFPGDLFPAGILSENDLKDIQKSMEEQAKKEAEKQKQQEDASDGNGEEGNAEDESGNTGEGDQSGNDQSSNDANANQTEGSQNGASGEVDAKDESEANDGKLNTGAKSDKSNSGFIVNNAGSTGAAGVTNLSNGKKLSKNRPTNGYSYNNLQPNNYQNINSNVQYEDDKLPAKNVYGQYRPNNNLSPGRDYVNQGQPGYDQNDLYASNRPMSGGYGGSRINDPYANNYGSQVDYSPEYNQDRLNNADRFNQDPNLYASSPDYNPMNNYRPNELLSRHLTRQHGDMNNYNYNDRGNNLRGRNYLNGLGGNRPRIRNYLNSRTQIPSNSLGNDERSAVNYDPEN